MTVRPVRNVPHREYAPRRRARPCDRLRHQQRQTRGHNAPKGPGEEVDGHGAIFAKWDTPSDYSDNQKINPSGCPPDLVDSKSKTRPSKCQDQFARDVETSPNAGCGLFPTRENFCGTLPHATRDLAKTPDALPIAE